MPDVWFHKRKRSIRQEEAPKTHSRRDFLKMLGAAGAGLAIHEPCWLSKARQKTASPQSRRIALNVATTKPIGGLDNCVPPMRARYGSFDVRSAARRGENTTSC